MADQTIEVASGTTGALANAFVAVDRISSADYQRVKLQKSTAGSAVATGVDADPLVVKNRRRGTADYDSGRVAVAAALTAITTATIYPEQAYVANLTDTERWITVTDTAGNEWISQMKIAPRMAVELPLKLAEMIGLKAQAEAASALILVVVGSQA